MDYEKKYKKALERAKKLKETCDSQAVIGWCEYIFPELKELEDERIRKALIKGFNECLDSSSYPKNAQKYWHGIAIEDIFAWLEKQGEQKPAWSEEDDAMLNSIIEDFGDGKTSNMLQEYWLKSLKTKVQPKQKWSEEDEYNLNSCIEAIEACYKWDSMVDWLKSIKERYTWKPSDGQMQCLLSEVEAWTKGCPKQKVLESLYNDLKKLTE